MGEKKIKISDVSAATGINRGTLTRLYYEETERIEIGTLDKLCDYFDCGIQDIFEYIKE